MALSKYKKSLLKEGNVIYSAWKFGWVIGIVGHYYEENHDIVFQQAIQHQFCVPNSVSLRMTLFPINDDDVLRLATKREKQLLYTYLKKVKRNEIKLDTI